MRTLSFGAFLCIATLGSGCGDDTSSGGAGGNAGGEVGGAGGENSGGGGASCEVDTTYDPEINPDDFQDVVDNPLFPLVPGTRLLYSAPDGETVEIEVLDETKVILGVTCTVVHDVAKINGEVIEDTLDWYAQDVEGTVWYFGEDTKEYSNGEVVSTAGSWEGGVDGAKPGIIIPGNPTVGMMYRQEYYACEAEDYGEILELSVSVSVPAGDFDNCLKTRDTTPLEPDVEEEKYYCPGVGNVLAVEVESGGREELETITPP